MKNVGFLAAVVVMCIGTYCGGGPVISNIFGAFIGGSFALVIGASDYGGSLRTLLLTVAGALIGAIM